MEHEQAKSAQIAQQNALVTGAGRGIGRAVALRLAAMGARVVLVARDRTSLETVQREIDGLGGASEAFPCDLSSPEAISELAQRFEDRFGHCDVLVNNAGIGAFGRPLHETPPETWDALMAVNLRAPYLLMRALAPGMIAAGRGHIVNISSLAGKNPLPNGAAYAATKWALNGLSSSVAEELRPHGVRVSVVCPGSVDTGLSGGGGKDPSLKLQPEDVADIVALLVAQPARSFISEVLVRPTRK